MLQPHFPRIAGGSSVEFPERCAAGCAESEVAGCFGVDEAFGFVLPGP